MPADGFYEWRRGPQLDRQPYHIRRADGCPFALAGLWASWHDPEKPRDNDPLRSATMLTTGPSALLGQIHSRMPVILPELDWDRRLDPTLTDATSFFPLLGPAPETCSRHPGRTARETRPRNQGPQPAGRRLAGVRW